MATKLGRNNPGRSAYVRTGQAEHDGGAVTADITGIVPKGRIAETPLDLIVPNPHQPRRHFDDGELRELADSIRRNGLQQPIRVKRLDNGGFQLVSGERRLRAHQILGLPTISAYIVTSTDPIAEDGHPLDHDDGVGALIENVRRSDLTAIEIGEAYQALIERHGIQQSDLVTLFSRGKSSVSKHIALTRLPDHIRQEAIALRAPLRQLYDIASSDAGQHAVLWERLKATLAKEARSEIDDEPDESGSAGDDGEARHPALPPHESGYPPVLARAMARARKTIGKMRTSPAPLSDADRNLLEEMREDIEALLRRVEADAS